MPRQGTYGSKRRKIDNTLGKAKKASKARSCEACRRLKTRCELHPESDRCHRCEILQIECSYLKAAHNSNPVADAKINPRSVQCDYHARISALEASITQIQAKMNSRCPDLPRSPPTSSIAERTTRDAPMNLIQEIRDNITIQRQPSGICDFSEDIIVNGIVSEDLASSLLKGFLNMSSRWLFMNADTEILRTRSPLLFGACVLAGIHVNSTLHGSPTHHALYLHVQGLLGRSHLTSTSLDIVQAMLIFSMWDLRPMRDHDHGNSWLLSGTAAMQLILITPFEDLMRSSDGLEKPCTREIMRTWNLVCLCHLQFSVGSGRPPVIAGQYLDQCGKIVDFPSYNARDGLVLAGVQLYRTVWSLISSNVTQTADPSWFEIDSLRKAQESIYNLDSSEPLRFAYACSYLILARRTLQQISESQSEDDNKTRPFILFAVQQSRKTLEHFLSLSYLTSYVHPSYENLLCSFAMVTLAEFIAYVSEIGEVVVLMERAISHIQRGGKAEPVGRWALNVVQQHILGDIDERQATSGEVARVDQVLSSTEETIARPWEDGYWEQDFPSLEEMFFGSML